MRWKLLIVSLLAICAGLLPGFASVAQARPLPAGPGVTSLWWAGVVANFPVPKAQMVAEWVVACPNHKGPMGSVIPADPGSTVIQALAAGANLNVTAGPVGVGTIVTDTSQPGLNGTVPKITSSAVAYLQNGGAPFLLPSLVSTDTVNCGDTVEGAIWSVAGTPAPETFFIEDITKGWFYQASFGPAVNMQEPQCLVGRDGGDLMSFFLTGFSFCEVQDAPTHNPHPPLEGIGDCPDGSNTAFFFPGDCSTWQLAAMQKSGSLPMAGFSGPPSFGKAGVVSNGAFDILWG